MSRTLSPACWKERPVSCRTAEPRSIHLLGGGPVQSLQRPLPGRVAYRGLRMPSARHLVRLTERDFYFTRLCLFIVMISFDQYHNLR